MAILVVGRHHCPQCQTRAKEAWLAQRRRELLPVPYFHLVFTLPHALHGSDHAGREAATGPSSSKVGAGRTALQTRFPPRTDARRVCHVLEFRFTRLATPLTVALALVQPNEVYPPPCPLRLSSFAFSGG